MEYVCKFADERGQIQELVEQANSEAEVRDRFAKQGLLVYSVRPKGGWAAVLHTNLTPSGKKIRLEEFLIFNQQFVTLVKAGLPILKALDLLGGRVAQPELRDRIVSVRERVRTGMLLSEAFDAEGAFPKIYVTTVMAGEKSGSLEEVLTRYIGYQQLALAVQKKILVSLIYPSVLLTLVVTLVTFLTTYVVPRFAELYQGLDAQLPPMTEALLAFGIAAQRYLPLMLLGAGGVVFAIIAWARSERGADILDRIKVGLPFVGEIWLKYQVAQFARMLATLLAGGIPLVQALDTVRQSFRTQMIRRAMETATTAVREGRTLSGGLRDMKLMPDLAIEMVEVGETTGALPQMLNSVAEFYEQDVATRMQAVLALIEPAILIFVSVVVSFVLLSLYLPIFSLAERIH